MNENIIRLAARWALADTDLQAALCEVLGVEIAEVFEAAESLSDLDDKVQLVDSALDGVEIEEYGIVHPDFEDPNPESTHNRYAGEKREYFDTFNYDYFGDDYR